MSFGRFHMLKYLHEVADLELLQVSEVVELMGRIVYQGPSYYLLLSCRMNTLSPAVYIRKIQREMCELM